MQKTEFQKRNKNGQKMIGVLESLEYADITVTYLHHLLITKIWVLP